MQRYDLVTNYRCGSSIEEMERADEGEWVRYEDVEELRARLRHAVETICELWEMCQEINAAIENTEGKSKIAGVR